MGPSLEVSSSGAVRSQAPGGADGAVATALTARSQGPGPWAPPARRSGPAARSQAPEPRGALRPVATADPAILSPRVSAGRADAGPDDGGDRSSRPLPALPHAPARRAAGEHLRPTLKFLLVGGIVFLLDAAMYNLLVFWHPATDGARA